MRIRDWSSDVCSSDLRADDLVSLLTPVIKGFGTDKGYEVATNAQQVFGGHGYIEEQGMSQYVRDARITMIYEGANGVQAMGLVGRKLAQNGGRAIRSEEHTSELQSLMRISYAVFCLKKKNTNTIYKHTYKTVKNIKQI